MGEWLQSIQDYFNQVGDSVNTLMSDVQNLVDEVHAAIQVAQAYMVFSTILLVVLFIAVGALIANLRRMEKKLDLLCEKYEKQGEI
jgi:hypothetical protein